MTQDDFLIVVGRLYIETTIRDNEIRRLRALIEQYEQRAKSVVEFKPVETDDGDADGTRPE